MFALLVVVAGCSVPPPAGDPTATPGTDGGRADLVTPPLNASAVLDAHATSIAERGSVTVRRNMTIRWNNLTRTQWHLGRYDLERGAALVTRKSFVGTRSTKYLAENGSAYERRTLSTGKEQLFGPETASGPRPSVATRPWLLTFTGNLSLTYEGRGTYGGVSGYRYTSSNASAFVDSSREYNRSDVRSLAYALVLAADGRLKYARFEVTLHTDRGWATAVQTVRFERVGATTVSPPAWLGDAVRKARRPGPNDQVTRTFEASSDAGRVVQAITAKKYDLERGDRGVGPVVSENSAYHNENLNAVRVGPVVRLYWPESTTRVEATFHYDPDDVPADERALTVTVFDRSKRTFVALDDRPGANVSVDPASNTVTVAVTDADLLERYQGNTFVAMDYEALLDRLDRG